MTTLFLQRLCALITDSGPHTLEELPFVRQAFEDTLAVTYAGWAEPVTRKVASAYGAERMTPESPDGTGAETAALILGTAGHALDYDDVHQVSQTHPSIPIVAALTAVLQEAGPLEKSVLAGRLPTAFGVGLATNVAIGHVLGFSHYQKGWHATSTIGPLAAAAALAHLYRLGATQAAHALALAAAQAGGLQRNFGQMAKPLQAGMAGATAVRAVRLARGGVTADPDLFAEKGYFDLYGGEELAANPDDIEFDLQGGGICVKLYPCCYGNHRHIANALEIRESLRREGIPLEKVRAVHAEAPVGAYTAVRVTNPTSGLEGKFCLAYNIAAALVDGEVGLGHFEDQAVQRADLREMMAKVTWSERLQTGEKPVGLRFGSVSLTAGDGQGNELARAERAANPGSPESSITEEQMETKVRDCLAYHARTTGRPLEYAAFQTYLDRLFTPAKTTQMALGEE